MRSSICPLVCSSVKAIRSIFVSIILTGSISWKINGYKNGDYISYRNELLSEVISDLENEIDIFKYQNFPTCFNCKDCKIESECFYIKVLTVVKKVQEKHKTNQINQNDLKWIYELWNYK